MFYGIAQESIPRFQEALRAVLAIYPRHFAQDMLITLDRNMGFCEDTAFMQAFKGEAGKDQEASLLWRRRPRPGDPGNRAPPLCHIGRRSHLSLGSARSS